MTVVSRTEQLQQWLASRFNDETIALETVSGDASFRHYFRFTHQGKTYIGVDAPPDKEDSRPFVTISRAYAARGMQVPEVIHDDMALGFMCLSDLGDALLLPVLNDDSVDNYYQKALAMLVDVAAVTETEDGPLPVYDHDLLYSEMALFHEWLLPQHLGMTVSPDIQQMLETVYQQLIDCALSQVQVGVHRDFHSRNLMILEDDSLAVIDYQDGVVGAITYDPVSLLRDCYIRWPEPVIYRHLLAFKGQMVEHYPELGSVDDKTFIRWFDWMGLQRHIKVCGIFARLYHRDGKSGYLADIPRVLDYVIDVAAKYPEFADLVRWLEAEVKPALSNRTAEENH